MANETYDYPATGYWPVGWEPTEAAPTLAWSEETNIPEPAVYVPRRLAWPWMLLIGMGVGAVIGLVCLLAAVPWSTSTSAPTMSANPDQVYLTMVKAAGVEVNDDPSGIIAYGHQLCAELVTQDSETVISVEAVHQGDSPDAMRRVVQAARTAYCPA
jgi:hypothetical protein